VKITKVRIKRSHPDLPAETIYIAEARTVCHDDGKRWTFRGSGATVKEARLDLLWQQGRRRIPVDWRLVR
jgi:hypothetical protein